MTALASPADPSLQLRVRERRVEAGLSQAQLAERIGLSRQAINALENGHAVPSTTVALRLARELGCTVEDLFALGEAAPVLDVRVSEEKSPPAERVAIARVRGRLIAHPLASARGVREGFVGADGMLVHERGRVSSRLLISREMLEGTALLLGCDPGLDILREHFDRTVSRRDVRLKWLPAPSRAALRALERGEAHVGGTHLVDKAGHDANVSGARKALAGPGGIVVGFAQWQQGLVVAAGNPKSIRQLGDLARKELAFVNREAGSGSRVLLEQLLRKEGIPFERIRGFDRVTDSHFGVARLVLSGSADAGIALRAAAELHGLGFVPLAQVRFDLVVPADHVEHPAVSRLLELLSSGSLRREIGALPGYDVGRMGDVLGKW